jgi:hypothetical protein
MYLFFSHSFQFYFFLPNTISSGKYLFLFPDLLFVPLLRNYYSLWWLLTASNVVYLIWLLYWVLFIQKIYRISSFRSPSINLIHLPFKKWYTFGLLNFHNKEIIFSSPKFKMLWLSLSQFQFSLFHSFAFLLTDFCSFSLKLLQSWTLLNLPLDPLSSKDLNYYFFISAKILWKNIEILPCTYFVCSTPTPCCSWGYLVQHLYGYTLDVFPRPQGSLWPSSSPESW